jgi:uncharacterized protein (DUF2147 family)
MRRIISVSIAFLFLTLSTLQADPIEGYWKRIDEETNKVTAVWKLEIKNKQLYGYIVNFPDFDAEKKCSACEDLDGFEGKPILGTPWIHLTEKDEKWEEGYIIDSGKGKKYDAKLWVEGNTLKVRGYIGFFYRTQDWKKGTATDADPNQTVLVKKP